MSPIKCPSCGHRILNPGRLTACTNCGAPLAAPFVLPEASMASSQADTFSQPVVDSNPAPSRANFSSTTSTGSHNQDTLPFPSISSMRGAKEASLGALGFLKPRQRPPDLEGTLILVNAHEEPRRRGISDGIFKALLDFLWAIPGGPSAYAQQEKELVYITFMRVRTSDGAQRDARLQGRLTGVNLALGDTVSLWGRKRKGLLIVQRGYNHTSEGNITTRGQASPYSGLLLIIVGIIGFIVLILYFRSSLWPH